MKSEKRSLHDFPDLDFIDLEEDPLTNKKPVANADILQENTIKHGHSNFAEGKSARNNYEEKDLKDGGFKYVSLSETGFPEKDIVKNTSTMEVLTENELIEDDFNDDLFEVVSDINDFESVFPHSEDKSGKRSNRLSKVNWHTVFGISIIVFIGLLVLRFFTWGKLIDLNLFPDNEETPYGDVLDYFVPAPSTGGFVDDGITTIVAFGNAPFADDRDSADNLARIIGDLSGATIYNCSVSDTYLAAVEDTFRSDAYPMDAFNFYWLTTLITLDNQIIYDQAFERMGEDTPADARETYNTLINLDFNTVDVITLMYDGSDYLAGHQMYNDENPTDILQFTGNMEAGIELLQLYYPHIRIIVMSPTYAFAVDEEGKYVSSDMYRYGQDVLSTYAIKQYGSAFARNVTFVDHLYGTITEDIATEYLTDNIHLDLEGRRLVAERFVYALNYFNG